MRLLLDMEKKPNQNKTLLVLYTLSYTSLSDDLSMLTKFYPKDDVENNPVSEGTENHLTNEG
jgi:hypothetical protein